MSIQLTPGLVRGLWHYLDLEYKSKTVSKAGSGLMSVVGAFLGQMGILDKKKFMDKYATTIGHTIYVPYEVGSTEGGFSLISQASTCAHEHMHVAQYDRLGAARFAWKYLGSTAGRAELEAEAMRVSMTMRFGLTGNTGDPADYAAKLESYGIPSKDREFVKKYLEISRKMIENGAVPDRVSHLALEWLKSNQ